MPGAMAIRFACGACSQPIEVDDEWASKQVACPYCHNTITAPPETTLTDLSSIPTATPLTAESLGRPTAGYGVGAAARTESPNRLAIVAAVLVVAAAAMIVMYGRVLAAHADEFSAVMTQTEELAKQGQSSLGAAQRAWSDFYAENGGVPPDWLLGVSALTVVLLLTWLAALVCSIIACRRQRRRGLAIGALVASCLLPFFFCGLVGTTMAPLEPPVTTTFLNP